MYSASCSLSLASSASILATLSFCGAESSFSSAASRTRWWPSACFSSWPSRSCSLPYSSGASFALTSSPLRKAGSTAFACSLNALCPTTARRQRRTLVNISAQLLYGDPANDHYTVIQPIIIMRQSRSTHLFQPLFGIKTPLFDNKMLQSVGIRQAEWDSPFFSVLRQDALSLFVNLHALSERSPLLSRPLPKCKFCKAYPFSIGEAVAEDQQRECELCGGVNEHQMRFSLASPAQELLFRNHSYSLPSPAPPTPPTLILFLQTLEQPEAHHFIEALKIVAETLTIPASVLLTVRGKLAVVDFAEVPELVMLSKDNNVREKIEETRCVLTPQMVDQLYQILLALSQQPVEVKKMNEAISFSLLEAITCQFQQKTSKRTDIYILLWVGTVPSVIKPIPAHGLCTIALLTLTRKQESCQLLIELSTYLTEVHYLAPPETSTQLYYKIHQILSHDYLGRFISAVITLRSNQKYSGDLRAIPERLINASTPPIEVSFASSSKFKAQIRVPITNQAGQHFDLVANCEQPLQRRRILWFERVILMSRALSHVKQLYFKLRKGEKNPGFDYQFIGSELQKFREQFQNRTELYRAILLHMCNYFKEFQKDGGKMFIPFGLIGRKELLFVFYPLWQGGILHHWDRMWVGEGGEDNVEWCLELLGEAFTVREHKLPIFYQFCIDNENYCYVEQ